MLELFARHPDALPMAKDLHITDIPTGEDMSSLSAILLDEEYYSFALTNNEIIDGLRLANSIALIGLKAKAYLNNLQRKVDGHDLRSDDIDKHRRDIIRLAVVIPGDQADAVTERIRADMALFIERGLNDPDQVRMVLKSLRLGIHDPGVIANQLRAVFGIAR